MFKGLSRRLKSKQPAKGAKPLDAHYFEQQALVTKAGPVIDRAQVRYLASRGLTIDQIADVLGISYTIFTKCRKEDIYLDLAISQGRGSTVADVANALLVTALNGKGMSQVEAAKFYLKSQAAWNENPQNESNQTPMSVTFKIDSPKQLTVDSQIDLTEIPLRPMTPQSNQLEVENNFEYNYVNETKREKIDFDLIEN